MRKLLAWLMTSGVRLVPYCVVTLSIACTAVVVTYFIVQERDATQTSEPSVVPVVRLQQADLRAGCASGELQISNRTIISEQTIDLDSACQITLSTNASLTFESVSLKAPNLYVYSAAGSAHTKVEIFDSAFTGEGGFQVSLRSNQSSIEVNNSSFEYKTSVGLSTGLEDADEAAVLVVRNSQFVVLNEDNEGINLASTGMARFSNNTFQTAKAEDYALLLAPDCQAHNNVGANQNCQIQ